MEAEHGVGDEREKKVPAAVIVVWVGLCDRDGDEKGKGKEK
jgi:hypothetical protein